MAQNEIVARHLQRLENRFELVQVPPDPVPGAIVRAADHDVHGDVNVDDDVRAGDPDDVEPPLPPANDGVEPPLPPEEDDDDDDDVEPALPPGNDGVDPALPPEEDYDDDDDDLEQEQHQGKCLFVCFCCCKHSIFQTKKTK